MSDWSADVIALCSAVRYTNSAAFVKAIGTTQFSTLLTAFSNAFESTNSRSDQSTNIHANKAAYCIAEFTAVKFSHCPAKLFT